MKGMRVYIYRAVDFPDGTNGGSSGRAAQAILVGEGVPEISEPREGEPVYRLMKHTHVEGYWFVRPIEGDTDKKWYMFGGNFVQSSDSRFPNRYPLPIHDRTETQEQQRGLD